VIKILQGSAVTQTVLDGLSILSSGGKFPIVHISHKLWKLAGSRHTYCKNKQAYFFGPPCTFILFVRETDTIYLKMCEQKRKNTA